MGLANGTSKQGLCEDCGLVSKNYGLPCVRKPGCFTCRPQPFQLQRREETGGRRQEKSGGRRDRREEGGGKEREKREREC